LEDVENQLERQSFKYRCFEKKSEKKNHEFYREIVRQKLAYAGHVLRRSGGRNALEILEGKIEGKKGKDRTECVLTTSGNGQC